VKTSSGTTALQMVWSSRRGSRSIEHIGSAHDEAALAALKAAAAQRLAAGQAELDLGVAARSGSEPLPITSSRAAHLWDALCRAYEVLGFERGGWWRRSVPPSGVRADYRTDQQGRLVARVGRDRWGRGVVPDAEPTTTRVRQSSFPSSTFESLRRSRRARSGLLVLYDVSTVYFETDAGDGFREPGFSKERRLEPHITLGLLTDPSGFPLTVAAFEGNKAETVTMLPVINAFKTAHRLTDVTVVADVGMISEANQVALQAAGLSFMGCRSWVPGFRSGRCGARMARQPLRRGHP
jgi:hypothetical protein